jgi:hypothetical protein
MHDLTPANAQSQSPRTLRRKVLESLKDQGFVLGSDGLIKPDGWDKESVRQLHVQAIRARVERAKEGLARHESRLLKHFASGDEVEPERIVPVLREVHPGTEDELLFRYARLHWSVPISAGYGRRLRFLVFDEHNSKLIGLFGLGDPVFGVGPRDQWIGWNRATRRERLRHVMDAFVVGAVPPYSNLLCGKLIAMLLTSEEVRHAFRRKYARKTSLITGNKFDGRLALITTTSALGRSSIYNRLKFDQRPLFVSVGFTRGSGEFHLSNGVYKQLMAFANSVKAPTAKHGSWGGGWRNKREVLRSALPELGLSRELLYHGVKREIFVVPMARNAQKFLRGEHARLQSYRSGSKELFEWFRERWLLPRARRDDRYRYVSADSLRLWGG